jgi:hypothetical protein
MRTPAHALLILLAAMLLTLGLGGVPSGAQQSTKDVPRRGSGAAPVLVHYMPWFEGKPTSPAWGWHWTMNHYDPDTLNAEQRRAVASHDYPLAGAYDSSDPDLLEYHALLMKAAGINGVIVDWYGTADFNDYALIHRNTTRLIETLKRFGLKFAICYEDQSVRQRVERGVIKPAEAVAQGKQDLLWLSEHWFKEPLYVKLSGKPVLLAFGTPYFSAEQWRELLAATPEPPALYVEDNLIAPAEGVFGWTPMWMSREKRLTQSQVDDYLKQLYAKPCPTIGIAFPGYHDIYEEAKVHPSFGRLDADGGAVLARTLKLARDSKSPLIQIATWNDFGEGTTVEPAREYGYRYLEMIQNSTAMGGGDGSHLRLPLQVFQLRKRTTTPEQRKALDDAVEAVKARKYAEATRRLAALSRQLPPPSAPGPR